MYQFDGGRLAEHRKRAKLSQSYLASMLDTSQQSVARWENGRSEPTLAQLCTLADFYGVSLDELLGRNAPGYPPDGSARPFPLETLDVGDGDLHISKSDLPKIAKAIRKIAAASEVLDSLFQTQNR